MSIFEFAVKSAATAAIRVATLLSATAAILRVGFARFAADRRAHRTARPLDRLSDRELKDIGLSRLDIEHLARSGSRRLFAKPTRT